jgi:hypothetical protein
MARILCQHLAIQLHGRSENSNILRTFAVLFDIDFGGYVLQAQLAGLLDILMILTAEWAI